MSPNEESSLLEDVDFITPELYDQVRLHFIEN